MRVVRLPRRLPPLRHLGWPLALLAAIALFVVGGRGSATVSTPASSWHRAQGPQGLPISGQTLRYLFAQGLPTIGLALPPGGPLSEATGVRLAGFLGYTLTGVAPSAPESVLQSAFSGFAFVRGYPGARDGSLGSWLQAVDAGQRGTVSPRPAKAPQGVLAYGGGTPLVAIYATEGEAAFVGHEPSPNAAPPASADRRKNALGLAQSLARALAGAGVPTVFANRVNDGEGELGAYLNSAAVLGQFVRQYPELALIIDVERPLWPKGPAAVGRGSRRVATLTLVVGTDSRLPDPGWRQNLALAKSLGAFLARSAPGVFLGIEESPDRLNQELAHNALTLDVGGPAATPAQALRAIPLAVGAILAYLSGQPVPANP